MNHTRRTLTIAGALVATGLTRGASAQPMAADDAGRRLRLAFLRTTANDAALKPNVQFPRVYGAATDWAIGNHTATIAALADGNASLYTTSTFGVIGCVGHASVRQAAQRFVELADKFLEDSLPATDLSHPAASAVRFFLLTYSTGLRMIEAPRESIYANQSKYTPLFGAAQDVLTELRKVAERK